MGGAKFFASIADQMTFQRQPDIYLSQANPVSGTLYEVLPTTRNVQITSIGIRILWGVTQPTPLEVVITIDGGTIIHQFINPVSDQWYTAVITSADAPATQPLIAYSVVEEGRQGRGFLYEGRSVRVQVCITWAVTQPTPLSCRVKWARR